MTPLRAASEAPARDLRSGVRSLFGKPTGDRVGDAPPLVAESLDIHRMRCPPGPI